MPRLAAFIRKRKESILEEWETFARALPIGGSMDVEALRDHAAQMLEVIAKDLDEPQTQKEQSEKAKGASDADKGDATTAAQEHGAGRADSGFSVAQMIAEFRALRASVVRLWTKEQGQASQEDLDDLVRFNEAIDQSIAESITQYTDDLAYSKERFLAILGHDLRTPLGAVITSTGFMLDTGELQEPYHTLVTRIASSSRRMNQMVEDLLDFTLTRFGDTIPVVRAPIDLRNIVTDVASEIGASFPKTTVKVETTGDLRGDWDCDRLTQAFTNLLSNAVAHGSAESPIRVVARGLPAEVLFSVHNEGPIIPADRLATLFTAMADARGNGARDKRHLGLGLYIVEKIVSAHGGTVDVQSTREEGTTFMVHLPRKA